MNILWEYFVRKIQWKIFFETEKEKIIIPDKIITIPEGL